MTYTLRPPDSHIVCRYCRQTVPYTTAALLTHAFEHPSASQMGLRQQIGEIDATLTVWETQ